MATDNLPLLSDASGTTNARGRIIAAFNAMMLGRQRGPFRVGDIIRQARVARSTFYDHFPNETALQLTALTTPFASVADALSWSGDPSKLVAYLEHFWDYRQQSHAILAGRDRAKIERMLAGLLAARLRSEAVGDSTRAQLCALQISAATLATLHSWLTGGVAMPAAILAQRLVATSQAIRASAGFS